jgi:hypothetical protein
VADDRAHDRAGQEPIDFTSPKDRARWQPPPAEHTKNGAWLTSIRTNGEHGEVWTLLRGRGRAGLTDLTINFTDGPRSITRAIINIRGIPLSLDACMDPDPAGPRHVTLLPRAPGVIPLDDFRRIEAEWRALLADGQTRKQTVTKPPRISPENAATWRDIIADARRAALAEQGKATYDTTAPYLAWVGITAVRTLKDYTKDLKRVADYTWPISY